MNFNRRSWYILAVLVPIVAWILGSAQLASRWDSIHEARPTPIGGKFDAAGQSVAVFTDFPQADRKIVCSITKPKAAKSEIKKPDIEIFVNYDTTRWKFIGLVDKGVDQMAIACLPDDGHTDGATYAYAVVPSTVEAAISAEFIVWGGVAFGFLISAVIGFSRYRSFKHGE